MSLLPFCPADQLGERIVQYNALCLAAAADDYKLNMIIGSYIVGKTVQWPFDTMRTPSNLPMIDENDSGLSIPLRYVGPVRRRMSPGRVPDPSAFYHMFITIEGMPLVISGKQMAAAKDMRPDQNANPGRIRVGNTYLIEFTGLFGIWGCFPLSLPDGGTGKTPHINYNEWQKSPRSETLYFTDRITGFADVGSAQPLYADLVSKGNRGLVRLDNLTGDLP